MFTPGKFVLQNKADFILHEVSLLTIILEQADKDHGTVTQANSEKDPSNGEAFFSISTCAQKLVEAVSALISAGERQSQAIRDEEFTEQMAVACEVLTLASDNLFIQAHRYELKHSSENMKHQLCQAAKEVLQGVLKMLLVSDDFFVRQLLNKTDSLLRLVKTVESIKDKTDLISTFKSITYAVLAFKVELSKRCQNLCSQACRDEIMIWVGVLQNSIPSLSKASQTYLKYRTSVSAKASRDSVLQEIVEACKRIKQLLQSGPHDDHEDNITSFVAIVDKVVDNLSEVNRGTLNPDIDSDIVFLIRHSMSVAHCASGAYREMIVASCHRILQSKFRLLNLDATLKEKPALIQIRSEFEHTCEVMLDEVCDLEKHVTLTLVQLIIETFLSPLDELAQLKDAAGLQSKNKQNALQHEKIGAEFSEYTEKLCQISLLVAASTADTEKVREIVTSVRCLESLEPDFAPAVLVLKKEPKNAGARKHLKLLMERWAQEVGTIINAVDCLVDPEVFMDITEQILTNEVETFKTMFGCSHEDVQKHFHRFVCLSERPGVLARKLLDENSDPVYRNGLEYFIKLLFQRINEAEKVYMEILQTTDPPTKQYDTVERRMTLVAKAVKMLREGFDVKNHPRLLSAKRMISKHQRRTFDLKLVGGTGKQCTVTSQPIHTHVKGKQPEGHNSEVKVKQPENPNTEGKNMQPESSNTEMKNLQSQDAGTQNLPSSLNVNEDTTQTIQPGEPHKATAQTIQPGEPHKAATQTIQPGEPHKATTQVSLTLPEIFAQKEQEGGPARDIYHVAKSFLEACNNQDRKRIESMTHNLLSWTNHIVENAEKLLLHCCQVVKSGELQELQLRLEHVATELVQKAQFIRAGGRQDVPDLLQDVLQWAQVVNSARLIIDVSVDRWLGLTCELQHRLEEHNQYQLKIVMNTITCTQKDMCQLLTKTQSLSGKYIENGIHRIEYLADMRNEIENLTMTIKTTIDVAVVSANKGEDVWWHLAITCRDWSVAMSCVLCELDLIFSHMELVGREKFRGLQGQATKRTSQVVNTLEEETDYVLELVDCVTVGDNIMKSRSGELVAQLHVALSDLMAIAKLPTTTAGTSLEDLFNNLNLRLAVSKWVEKATAIQDMVRSNCYEYFGFTHQLLLRVQEILNEDVEEAVKKKERGKLTCAFLEKSQYVKQLVLRAIQLCPDLPRRVVVRTTLDTMAELTAQIEGVLRTSSRLSDADVSCLSQHWAARMKKLVYNLQRMDGVKPSVVLEIEKSNKAISGLYTNHSSQQYIQQQPHCISPRQEQQVEEYQLLQQNSQQHGQVPVPTPQKHGQVPVPTPHQHGQVSVPTPQQHGQVPVPTPHQHGQVPVPTPQKHGQVPVPTPQKHGQVPGPIPQQHGQVPVPTLQHHLLHNHPSSYNQDKNLHEMPDKIQAGASTSAGRVLAFNSQERPRQEASDDPSKAVTGSIVDVVVSDAKYLDSRLKLWHDDGGLPGSTVHRSKVIQAALDMARLCCEIALFTRGQGSLQDSEEVIGAAVAIVKHSSALEDFGRTLLSLAGVGRCSDNLETCIIKIGTCASQLHIISSTLHNSAKSHQGDRILMKNTLNLLLVVRQMFSLAEAIAIQEVVEDNSGDEITKDVLHLLKTIKSENEQYIRSERRTNKDEQNGTPKIFTSSHSLSFIVDTMDRMLRCKHMWG